MSNEDISKYLLNATGCLAEKNFVGAIVEFKKVLAIDENNIEALKGLGLCNFNLNEREKSLAAFLKVIELNEQDATALYYVASLSILMERTEDAITYSKKVLEYRPDFYDAYKILFTIYLKNKRYKEILELNEEFQNKNIETQDDTIHTILATTFMINKKYKEAISSLKVAIKISPEKPQLHNNLGVCYMSLGDYDSAINSLQTSLNLNDKNPLTYTDLGTVLQLKGEYLQALEAFNKALELEPESFINLLNVANLSNILRKYDLTINAYEKLLAINPDLKDIRNSLIGTYIKNKQPEKAINMIDVALKSNPKNVPLLFRKAKIYTMLEDFNAAQKIYEQIISFKKNSPSVYHSYALLHIKMGNYDKALQYLNKSVTLDDKNPSVHKDFGVIYLMRNQVEYAKDEFDLAAKLGDTDNEILKECADFYYSISDFEKADELYKKSLALENNPFTSLSRGINLIAQNKLEEAFAVLEPLLSVLPDNPELLYNLARIFYAQKDYDKAARLAKKAYFVAPTVEIANLMGLALMNLEDYRGAGNIFDKIIEQYPLNLFVYENLINCYEKTDDKVGLAKAYRLLLENFQYREDYTIKLAENLIAIGQKDEAKKVLDKAYFEHPSEELKKNLI